MSNSMNSFCMLVIAVATTILLFSDYSLSTINFDKDINICLKISVNFERYGTTCREMFFKIILLKDKNHKLKQPVTIFYKSFIIKELNIAYHFIVLYWEFLFNNVSYRYLFKISFTLIWWYFFKLWQYKNLSSWSIVKAIFMQSCSQTWTIRIFCDTFNPFFEVICLLYSSYRTYSFIYIFKKLMAQFNVAL